MSIGELVLEVIFKYFAYTRKDAPFARAALVRRLRDAVVVWKRIHSNELGRIGNQEQDISKLYVECLSMALQKQLGSLPSPLLLTEDQALRTCMSTRYALANGSLKDRPVLCLTRDHHGEHLLITFEKDDI